MQEKIRDELQTLVEEGQGVMRATRFIGNLNEDQIKLAQNRYAAFKTRALNLMRRAFGADSDHYQALQFQRLANEDYDFIHFPECLGIVEAAQHDLEAGLLFNLRALIEAELLGDFIDQAETLLAGGYHIPAASLAGAVLEDTLRKMWSQRGWSLEERTSINSLNSALARAQAYNSLTQKQITANADLRNNADHGRYEQVKTSDVEDMVRWVRRFAEEHLK